MLKPLGHSATAFARGGDFVAQRNGKNVDKGQDTDQRQQEEKYQIDDEKNPVPL